MKRLVQTDKGSVEVTLPPEQVSGLFAEFDEHGKLLREEEYDWYNASQLAMNLIEMGVAEADAEGLAEELVDELRAEEREGPEPEWVPRGCLGQLLYIGVVFGIWVVGLAFLVWLVATRVF